VLFSGKNVIYGNSNNDNFNIMVAEQNNLKEIYSVNSNNLEIIEKIFTKQSTYIGRYVKYDNYLYIPYSKGGVLKHSITDNKDSVYIHDLPILKKLKKAFFINDETLIYFNNDNFLNLICLQNHILGQMKLIKESKELGMQF